MKIDIHIPLKLEIDTSDENKHLAVLVGENGTGKTLYHTIRWAHQYLENALAALNTIESTDEEKYKKFIDVMKDTIMLTFTGPVLYTIHLDDVREYTIDYKYDSKMVEIELDKSTFDFWAENAQPKNILYNTKNIRQLDALDRFLMLAKMHNINLCKIDEIDPAAFDDFLKKIAPGFFNLPEITTIMNMLENIDYYNQIGRALKLQSMESQGTSKFSNMFHEIRINCDTATLEIYSNEGWKSVKSIGAGESAIISMILTAINGLTDIESLANVLANIT